MRILYFYLMRNEPDRVSRTAPHHSAYWQRLSLDDYEGGPFADGQMRIPYETWLWLATKR